MISQTPPRDRDHDPPPIPPDHIPRLPYTLAYVNAQGLSDAKYTTLKELFDRWQWGALVVAETWGVPRNATSCNWIMASSTLPATARTVGHQNGGLILVVPPLYQHHVSLIGVSEFSITFRYFHHIIRAVYLPPRLDDDTITTILTQHPPPHILLGDVNIRLGALTNDSTTTEPGRRDTIFTITDTHDLIHTRPTHGKTTTDLVFAQPGLVPDWGYYRNVIRSDHGLMSLELSSLPSPLQTLASGHSPSARPGERRPVNYPPGWWGVDGAASESRSIHLRDLVRTDVCERVCQKYLAFRGPLLTALASAEETPLSDRAAVCSTVDTLGLALQDTLLSVAQHTLGYYSVSRAKSRPQSTEVIPISTTDLHDPLTTTAAIRAFKRSRRGLQPTLTSGDANLTPNDATTARFSTTFSTCSSTPPDDPGGSLTYELSHAERRAFSLTSICDAIRRYPKCRSGGPDGLHQTLLTTLTYSTTFEQDVTAIFRHFLAVGATSDEESEDENETREDGQTISLERTTVSLFEP
ncbi:hypothetical protein DFS34DRAFT_163107 [Phlyctochytrium arcticum]|nr:hypothetical protein DFS34DRAFT_163107 [Phlyctochytrium arcticum]